MKKGFASLFKKKQTATPSVQESKVFVDSDNDDKIQKKKSRSISQTENLMAAALQLPEGSPARFVALLEIQEMKGERGYPGQVLLDYTQQLREQQRTNDQKCEYDYYQFRANLVTQCLAVNATQDRHHYATQAEFDQYTDDDEEDEDEAEDVTKTERRNIRNALKKARASCTERAWDELYEIESEFFQSELPLSLSRMSKAAFFDKWKNLRSKLDACRGEVVLTTQEEDDDEDEKVETNSKNSWSHKKNETAAIYTSLLRMIAADCASVLDLPSDQYALVSLGSIARGEGMPFSNVEVAGIVEDVKWIHRVMQAIRLFQLHLVFLGETPRDIIPLSVKMHNSCVSSPHGQSYVHLGLHFHEPFRVDTIPALLELQMDESVSLNVRSSLRQVASLCGSDSLVQSYRSNLQEYWRSHLPERNIASIESLSNASALLDPKQTEFDLDKAAKMIVVVLESLCRLYGVEALGCLAMITALQNKNVLNVQDAQMLRELVDSVNTRRRLFQLVPSNAFKPHCHQPKKSLLTNLTLLHVAISTLQTKLSTLTDNDTSKLLTFQLNSTASTARQNTTSSKDMDVKKQASPLATILLMVGVHVQPFLSLFSRMDLGRTCKSLRHISPGHVKRIMIHSTIDVRTFIETPPSENQSHILVLGGYWAEPRPYSKRHGIPQSTMEAYYKRDQTRRDTMKFTKDTMNALMSLRPSHRVVGLEFTQGTKEYTDEQLHAFWQLVRPWIGYLSVRSLSEDIHKIISFVFLRWPYLGSVARVLDCGNCWPFICELARSPTLESLFISWRSVQGTYYRGQTFVVPTLQDFRNIASASLPYLRSISLQIPETEGRIPSNTDIIASWLLPLAPNLSFLNGLSFDKEHVGSDGSSLLAAVGKLCNLKTLILRGNLTSVQFASLLQLPSLEALFLTQNSWNQMPIRTEPMEAHSKSLLHLHMGTIRDMKTDGVLSMLKACPNLHSFSIACQISESDVSALAKLIPRMKWAKIQSTNKVEINITIGNKRDVPIEIVSRLQHI